MKKLKKQDVILKKTDFEDAEAINLDCVAEKQHPNPSSVDMVICLGNKEICGVELKLNTQKTPPSKSKKLTQKKDGTKSLITGDIDIQFIVIFCHTNEDTKNLILHYLNRIERGNIPQHGYEMMFLDKFYKTYF